MRLACLGFTLYSPRFVPPARAVRQYNLKHVLSTFLIAGKCYLTKQLKEGKVCFGSQFKETVHHGREGLVAGMHPKSGSSKKLMQHSSPFLLFLQSEMPAY